MSNTYQKNSRRAGPDPMPGEITVPEQVIVSMAEIAGAARPERRGRHAWKARHVPGSAEYQAAHR